MTLDPDQVRAHFPALTSGAVFFDGPGGTQVPERVVERMRTYLLQTNANHGGAFATSRASDRTLIQARRAMAAFLNAASSREVIFGPNMTTLTLGISRALARELQPGDEIIVTRLDHDANIAPWALAAEDRGATIRWLDFDVEDCTLRMDLFDDLLTDRTRIVAVGYASNAVGTINPVREIVRRAHQAGALCYVDAVQYAPHGPIDVQDLDCDFLVVSAYKFYGPHIGALYGKRELLERLKAYKVRPAPDAPPGKFETGTQNHEGIAGALGALEYLADLGDRYGEAEEDDEGASKGMAVRLHRALAAIQTYERGLTRSLIAGLESIPGLTLYGLRDPNTLHQRVPTVSFTLAGHSPRAVAAALNKRGIYVWDGNYYALAVTERLGLEETGGMVRVGLVHYNTQDEVQRLIRALEELAA